jgi:capsid protein
MPQTQNWQPATLAAALGVPEEAFRAFARLRQIAWEKELSPPEAASLALAWVAADRAACDAEDKLDLYGLQALAMRAVVESGECFIRLLTVPTSPRNPIGLSLQVLESDHLDTTRNGMVDGAPTIQGIALGSAGEPIGYWLFPTHPGAWMLLGARLTSNFIPARDVSWLAPVLLRLRDLGDYKAALLMKAKIETCLAAVTDDGEETLTKANLPAALYRHVAKRNGKMCLAHPRWPEHDDILRPLDKGQAGQFRDLLTRGASGKAEIIAIQRLDRRKACRAGKHLPRPCTARFPLTLQRILKEVAE